jgi:hypothetical protein
MITMVTVTLTAALLTLRRGELIHSSFIFHDNKMAVAKACKILTLTAGDLNPFGADSVTFTAGDFSDTCIFPVLDDNIVEDPENFNIGLSIVSGDGRITDNPNQATAVGTILDDGECSCY